MYDWFFHLSYKTIFLSMVKQPNQYPFPFSAISMIPLQNTLRNSQNVIFASSPWQHPLKKAKVTFTLSAVSTYSARLLNTEMSKCYKSTAKSIQEG